MRWPPGGDRSTGSLIWRRRRRRLYVQNMKPTVGRDTTEQRKNSVNFAPESS
jgi:hypothetical protein